MKALGRRSNTIVLTALLVLTACGGTSVTTATEAENPAINDTVDGVLDCGDGEIEVSLDQEVSGASAEEVAELALEPFAAGEATVHRTTNPEIWSVLEGESEVAIAYIESDGGDWFSHDIRSCSKLDVSAIPQDIDGQLDCLGSPEWFADPLIDPTIRGLATPQEAITSALQLHPDFSPDVQIEVVGDEEGTLVVDGREVVQITVASVEAGGWVVVGSNGCEGFEYE